MAKKAGNKSQSRRNASMASKRQNATVPTALTAGADGPAADKQKSQADWFGRAVGTGGLLVAIWAVINGNKGAPDYFAAPSQMSYYFTQSNVLQDDKPHKGAVSIVVRNEGNTPARNVRVVVKPISANPVITSDQKYEVQDAPFGGKVVTIERVAPGHSALIDVLDSVESYPPCFVDDSLGGPPLKYQYFPVVKDVQTEFGSMRCDFPNCARFCLPLTDDNGGMQVNFGTGIR